METSLFQGLLNNVLITIGSCLLPMIVGVVAYMVCGKNKTLTKLSNLFGVIFESLCPIIILMMMFYWVLIPIRFNAILVCIIGFSISFLGYMPTRYNSDDSLLKNVVVNGIGLVSSIFKWSFCAGFIGVFELLRVTKIRFSISFEPSSFLTAIIISFAILIVLELMKFVAKEKL